MNDLKRQIATIKSIFGGITETMNYGSEGQYLMALGIDPELALGNQVKPYGGIAPTSYGKFSSTLLDSAPMWICGAPTTNGVFVFGANGTVLSYSGATFASSSEVAIGTPKQDGTPGAGDGLNAANDYLYAALYNDIARYGPLSSSGPTWTNSYWVSGLGMSALSSTIAYVSNRDVTYPQHVIHFHSDGRFYVAEYDGANGRLHSWTTDSTGANGSATYNDLTLPPGMLPMAMAKYGEDIAILCTPQLVFVGGTFPTSGDAAMYLWDAIAGHKFYREVPIHEPLATAICNKNGFLYILAGNMDANTKLLRYAGGETFDTLVVIPEGMPPPAGAVDALGNMIAWGGYVTYPTAAGTAFTYGFRSGTLPSNSLNSIARISNTTGSLPIVTCLKFLQRGNYPIVGWHTQDGNGLDKKASGTYANIFQSETFQVNRKGTIRRLRFPLNTNVQAGTGITLTFYTDNETASYTTGEGGLVAINNTNYSNNETYIDMQGLDIPFSNNFYLRFDFNGTAETAIGLPVEIEYDLTD